MTKKLPEHEHAIVLANLILERPNGDPDDDLATLSRQLLRTREKLEALWHFASCPYDHCDRCIHDAPIIKSLRALLGPATNMANFDVPVKGEHHL
jgi:hypothetical protein